MDEAQVIAACVHDLNATKGTNEPNTKEWYELSLAARSLMTQVAEACGTNRSTVALILQIDYDYSYKQAYYGDLWINE